MMEKANKQRLETERQKRSWAVAALIKVKVKPINHLWAPLVPRCLGEGGVLWAEMLGRPKAECRQGSRQGLPGPRAPPTDTALCCTALH